MKTNVRPMSRSLMAAAAVVALSGAGITVGATAAAATEDSITVCAIDCTYPTLNAAVTGAASGSTIHMMPGVHNMTASATISKPLTILGPNAGVSAVNGDRTAEAVITTSSSTPRYMISISSNDVTVEGLSFENAGISSGGARSNVNVLNNKILSGGSFYHESPGASNYSFIGNLIDPGVSGNNSGINITNLDGLTITDNVIRNTGFAGMNLANTNNTIVSNNTFANTPQQAVHLYAPTGNTLVSGNSFTQTDTVNNEVRGALVISNGAARGDIVVTGNTFTQNNRAINISTNLPATGVTMQVNENSFVANTQNLLNRSTGDLTVNATNNWWGVAAPDFASTTFGSVTSAPYYTNADRTSRSDTVTPVISLSLPSKMAPGAPLHANLALSVPATGTLELFHSGNRIASIAATDGAISFDLSALPAGTHNLQGVFTSSNTLAFASVTTAIANLVISEAPPAPPVADSSALDTLVENGTATPAEIVFPVTPGANTDLQKLDPSAPLTGDIPWAGGSDTFVDVFAFSSPVYIGTFPVVNGVVKLSADISGLPAGPHRLVFVGQSSGVVQVMAIAVTGTDGEQPVVIDGSTPVADGTVVTKSRSLAHTGGLEMSSVIGGVAVMMIVLGAVSAAAVSRRNRLRNQ